jgi:GNAT superfamily N-acetyltransferase
MKDILEFKLLTEDYISEISALGQQLNPKLTVQEVEHYQRQMFEFPTYNCFGLFLAEKLVGVSSGWITIRLYSGKQLEVDNVIIHQNIQSKGYGKKLFQFIEKWAQENGCKTVELNTYVQNSGSHKFYHGIGFSILGFHFWKQL